MLFKNVKIVDEDFNIKKDMYLRTQGPMISYIGETPPKDIEGEEIYDGKNKLLMPGFFNTHCHLPMTILRGYGEGLKLQDWLNKIFPFEAYWDPDSIYRASLLGALELIAGGCTSISDQYFFIDRVADALFDSGMKGNVCHGLSDMSPDTKLMDLKGAKDTLLMKKKILNGDYTEKEWENAVGNPCGGHDNEGSGSTGGSHSFRSRIRLDMGLHAEYTSCEEFIRQVAIFAKEEGLNIHTHISETKREHEECKERHGGLTPTEFFYNLGIFESRVQAAHCVYLTDHDMEIIKNSSSYVVHNPSSNMKLGSGIMPLKKYLEKGLSVGLGTDGAASNNSLNMMKEIHMAAMLSRVGTLDANAVSSRDILKMATRDGALMQGRDDCGLLKEGFRADIIVINLDTPNMQPDIDTISNVVFSADAKDIVLNMIDGKVVFKDGQYPHLDREHIMYDANMTFKKMLERL